MRKLKLSIEALQVDSFETSAAASGRGTVVGAAPLHQVTGSDTGDAECTMYNCTTVNTAAQTCGTCNPPPPLNTVDAPCVTMAAETCMFYQTCASPCPY